ncbi:hypothetical protein RSSM_04196 [Rhodopirellula sallentina SM41]|uniref:Uncharacterized protein n=1 Tax=Rhodopirellula sallentina SM41 TaxID=1263870 RepID=M5U937_9BACT|nr:hypothetical protein RSSM_04196 [Rhodopirellula sallentina SM41]
MSAAIPNLVYETSTNNRVDTLRNTQVYRIEARQNPNACFQWNDFTTFRWMTAKRFASFSISN